MSAARVPCIPPRGVAQPGSALRSGRRGPQFKSGHPDRRRGNRAWFPRLLSSLSASRRTVRAWTERISTRRAPGRDDPGRGQHGGGGDHTLLWVIFAVLLVVLLIALISLVLDEYHRSKRPAVARRRPPPGGALAVLDTRYASGELTRRDYLPGPQGHPRTGSARSDLSRLPQPGPGEDDGEHHRVDPGPDCDQRPGRGQPRDGGGERRDRAASARTSRSSRG